MRTLFTLTLLFTLLSPAAHAVQTWKNSGSPATVVELYTSEGCYSCPPAEAALNQLKNKSALWQRVIPMAFHVDYWNYIGWIDQYAKPEFSQRQRDKAADGKGSGVYTPGWFINDQEWRGFFARQPVPYANGPLAPALKASLDGRILKVEFEGDETLTAQFALLAMDITTQVKRGENRGKTLEHDFVVVDFGSQSGQKQWQFVLNDETAASPSAIAVWLTPSTGGVPVQTVAGWLAP